MATIKPFKALRPVKDKAGLISAQPYDSSHPEISAHEFQNNPYSYLHVVKSYMDFTGEKRDPVKHFPDGMVYLQKLMEEGLLVREKQPSFYIYRLIKGSKAYTTLIASASIDDYLDNRILKHENTLTDKLRELVAHISYFNSMGNPVLLTYPDNLEIDEILNRYIQKNPPEYNFISVDQVKHNLWVVQSVEDVATIEKAFAGMNHLYIADGHHRCAGVAAYTQQTRQTTAGYSGDEAFNFFPACLIPFSKLHIYEYHRLIKDDGVVNNPAFLESISRFFEITPAGNLPVQPLQNREFGIYLNHQAYLLKLKPEFEITCISTLQKLDVSIVEEFILRRVFGIEDSKTDLRLSFLDGSKGLGNLQKSIDQGENSIAITLYPVAIDELKKVAQENLIMPPKSTWIEPKIRTGLVIFETQ